MDPRLASGANHQHLHHGALVHEHQHQHLSSLDDHLNHFLEENQQSYHTDYTASGATEEIDGGGGEGMLVDRAYEDGATQLGGSKRLRTRLQTRSTKSQTSSSQPYPPPSPNLSRSSSFRIQLPLPLNPQADNPSSPFVPLPSPFCQSPLASSNGTMDPAHSVRSSSSSSGGSPPMSRVGSGSTTNSIYGGETLTNPSDTNPSASFTKSTSSNSSSRPQHHHHHHQNVHQHSSTSYFPASASPSPKKSRSGRKLTNADRKNICLYRDLNPSLKQDLIAEHFHVERSTVSKILKNREHWLALDGEEVETSTANSAPSPSPPPTPQLSISAHSQPPSPVKLFAPLSSSSSSSLNSFAAPASYTTSRPTTPPLRRAGGGRHPELENILGDWARARALAGHLLTDEVLREKAMELAPGVRGCDNFRGSPVWVEGFKSRAGIVQGTFEDLLSPNNVSRIKEEEATPESPDLDDGDDGEIDDEEDDTDEDFALDSHRTRGSRVKGKSRSSQKRTPSFSVARKKTATQPRSDFAVTGMARASSPSSRMDVDRTTPMRVDFGDPRMPSELDTTPTSSNQPRSHHHHHRQLPQQQQPSAVYEHNTYASGLALNLSQPSRPLSSSSYTHTPPSASSSSHPDTALMTYPYDSYSSGYASSSTSASEAPQLYAIPSQSQYPNQITYDHSFTNSETNSPASIHAQPYATHHTRSASQASTTSSFSGLTTFSSSQSSTPLSGSLFGSFSTTTSQSTSGSLPSTPATGYFNHGPDGTQSQLQAAFLVHQNSAPIPSPALTLTSNGGGSTPPVAGRRATISGVSYSSRPLASTPSGVSSSQSLYLPPSGIRAPPQSPQTTVSFEEALTSLQRALEYLSHDGQGIVSPADLVALSDVKGKMTAAQPRHSPRAQQTQPVPWPQPAGPIQRVTLGRAMSSGNVSAYGPLLNAHGGSLSARRSNSSSSLLSVADAMQAEERRM